MHMNHGVPSYATSPVTIAQLQMVRSGVFLVADHPIKSPGSILDVLRRGTGLTKTSERRTHRGQGEE
jgi:hypothetical protein